MGSPLGGLFLLAKMFFPLPGAEHPVEIMANVCRFVLCSLLTQVLNENARKPLSIGYLAFSLCSDILAALSVF